MPNIQTFSSVKNPAYRMYFGGLIGHMAGINMQMIARTLLVYRLTGSALILGLMSLANALPMLLLSLFGGAIADRVQKKYILTIGQASSALVSFGVALVLTFSYLSAEREGSWWILIMASALQGSIMGLMMPARQAIVPEIVGEDQIMNAMALNNFGMNIFRLLSPALAGLLIDIIGFDAIYYLMAGLYFISFIFTLFIPSTSKIVKRSSSALADIKDGLKYIRYETHILLVLVFTLICIFLSMPFIFLLPIFTDDILMVGATGMGVLVSVSGVGALFSSLVLASLPNKKRGKMMLMGGIMVGMALAIFAFSRLWYLSLILIAFIGIGQTLYMTLGSTLIQYYVSPTYRGRVMSILMMNFGLTGIGTFFAGMLSDNVGVQYTIGGFALVLVIIAFLAFIFIPKVRNLD